MRKRPAAEVATKIAKRHSELGDRLVDLAEALLAELPYGRGVVRARMDLVRFVREQVLPDAVREEAGARAVSGPGLDVLVRAMPGEGRLLSVLADEIEADSSGVASAAAAGALVALCQARWHSADRVLLPAMVASGADLRALTAR
ncbi:MAG TPA: hypothetical protein VFM01_14670 [Nakamurella sp.]|nr:hypothetical protein [Nakamurella sp.]